MKQSRIIYQVELSIKRLKKTSQGRQFWKLNTVTIYPENLSKDEYISRKIKRLTKLELDKLILIVESKKDVGLSNPIY